MNRQNKRDRFYIEAGEAMFMSNTRSFVNTETLEIDIHPEEDYFTFGDMEDTAREAMNNPDKFLAIPTLDSSEAFNVMGLFAESIKDNGLRLRLINALNNKRPFANFKHIIENSALRQKWFEFKDAAYFQIAKQWIAENANDNLKEKLKHLTE